MWRCDLTRVMASSFLRFLDHTQRRTTVGRNPLDEWSARRRDLYLTTHNTHNRQISMPPVGFEPTISAGERSQTFTLDRAATEAGFFYIHVYIPILCMFRAFLCSSSGELTVLIRHLVYVNHVGDRQVCRFGWNFHPNLHTRRSPT